LTFASEMPRGKARALQVIPRPPLKLRAIPGPTGVQGASNGGLLRTAFAAKGPLYCRVHPHRQILNKLFVRLLLAKKRNLELLNFANSSSGKTHLQTLTRR
jgi:hypothetical protein